MPVTLDNTVSGTNANTYASIADATAYFQTQIYGAPFLNAATDDDRAKALIEATNIIDLEQYMGDVAVIGQRLKWARTFVLQPFDPGIVVPPGAIPPGGYIPMPRYYDSTIIIRPVFEACCELANILIANTQDQFGQDDTLEVKTERIGSLSTEYVDWNRRARGIWRYPKVFQRLAPLVIAARQTRVTRA